jgi:hypothetical protein
MEKDGIFSVEMYRLLDGQMEVPPFHRLPPTARHNHPRPFRTKVCSESWSLGGGGGRNGYGECCGGGEASH